MENKEKSTFLLTRDVNYLLTRIDLMTLQLKTLNLICLKLFNLLKSKEDKKNG